MDGDLNVDYSKLSNPYYVICKMMFLAWKDENIYSNISYALNFLKSCLGAKCVSLYKVVDDKYLCINNQFSSDCNFNYIVKLLSLDKAFLDKNDYLKVSNYVDGKLSNLVFLSICFDEFKYVVAIDDYLLERCDDEFLLNLNQAFTIILRKLEFYEKSKKDILTGLYNRESYENMISKLNNSDEKIIFLFFDLFRLKYVNDNFGHLVGDDYIIKAAQILKKYFSMNSYYVDEFGILKKKDTGLFIYKIGGDEFVVISKVDSYGDLRNKADGAVRETKMIDLNVNDDVILGINYGISSRCGCESIFDLYKRADDDLNNNKIIMYNSLKLKRRQ